MMVRISIHMMMTMTTNMIIKLIIYTMDFFGVNDWVYISLVFQSNFLEVSYSY